MEELDEFIDKATPGQMIGLYENWNKELKQQIKKNKDSIRIWRAIGTWKGFSI